MGKAFKYARVMEILIIPTEMDTTNTDVALKRIPIETGLLNLLEDSKVTKDQVKTKSKLVWSDSKFGTTTPAYFGKFDIVHTDDTTLNGAKTYAKINHVIMEKKIWSSLGAEFQNLKNGIR